MVASRESDAVVASEFKETLLKVGTVATRLGISERKVWRMIQSGQIRKVQVGERGTRIAESELLRFMDTLGVGSAA